MAAGKTGERPTVLTHPVGTPAWDTVSPWCFSPCWDAWHWPPALARRSFIPTNRPFSISFPEAASLRASERSKRIFPSVFTPEINSSGQRQGSGRRPLGFEIIGVSGLFGKGIDQPTAKGRVWPDPSVQPDGVCTARPGVRSANALASRLSQKGSAGHSVYCRSLSKSGRPSRTRLPQPRLRPRNVRKLPGGTCH